MSQSQESEQCSQRQTGLNLEEALERVSLNQEVASDHNRNSLNSIESPMSKEDSYEFQA